MTGGACDPGCVKTRHRRYDAVQQRLANPQAMRQRRETVEHPFGTMKARTGATYFLTKTLPKVAAEMALAVLAYNLTRVMNIVGIKPLIAAIAARETPGSWLPAPTSLEPFLHGQGPEADIDRLGLNLRTPGSAHRTC
jgi:hypothetical protein